MAAWAADSSRRVCLETRPCSTVLRVYGHKDVVPDKATNSNLLQVRQTSRARGALSVTRDVATASAASNGAVPAFFRETFGAEFALLDVVAMEVLEEAPGTPAIDWLRYAAVCREVGHRGRPEIIEEIAPVALLAIPLADIQQSNVVAIGLFATQHARSPAETSAAGEVLGCGSDALGAWLKDATPWHPSALIRVARLAVAHLTARMEVDEQQEELLEASAHLVSTYEEISLLHRLTEHLSITSGEVELAALAIGWLADVVPAEGVAVYLAGTRRGIRRGGTTDARGVLTRGQLPLHERQLMDLVVHLNGSKPPRPIVANRLHLTDGEWPFGGVRDVVLAPVLDGGHPRGWLLALNHTGDLRLGSRDFGSVEARLLDSVATILGIHGSNLGLFQEQTDFFEEVVRTLTSAIDAKDPYTCGHSDRVARMSVCLARQLGLCADELNTLYLSGLLHDIGKIGIDDTVLRKPDNLTKEELEHIKTHPELGYKILRGVKRLDATLPVVLHHHENWDGTGYPHGLKGEGIPRLARICAVADGYDAMGSDRPYRAGMPDDEVDAILRAGAGRQWDPQVVQAFFAVREEIRSIARQERNPLSLNVEQWQK